ncbi:hypothetical protein [Mucilaginibacter gilvus]|uniref:Uncharacterized protein n=1 Tax=Mucilaginibacter gilvus TaxID=2305909 RepID=A0A3S3UT37_9SPHI|nr:hypothetical protein [Mucilaginibacter gilvus]RWY50030.1 hypothetical protein EPL05_14805 [Mucilaginibacter gilvus]
MKYLLLLVAVCLAACKQPAPKKTDKAKKARSTQIRISNYGQAVLKDYQKFLSGLGSNKMGSSTLAAKKMRRVICPSGSAYPGYRLFFDIPKVLYPLN